MVGKRVKTGLGVIAGASILVAGSALPASALATVKTYSCSSGGFTGTMYVRGTARNVTLHYKINKGSKSGGNKANVNLRDNGIAPTRVQTLGSGIQDNKEHFYASYKRGSGGFDVTFVFDKNNAFDPSCGTGGSF